MKKKGFTLIEFIVVLAIIATIASILLSRIRLHTWISFENNMEVKAYV